jgi:NAD(P)-dependent dehydrogenase (short-subunit alcohol dehydrogenase family)
MAAAKALCQSGLEVVITGRDEAKLEAARQTLGRQGRAERVDATSEEQARAFFERAGSFDHLVLSVSGAKGAGPFADLDLRELRAGFDAKFWAQIGTAQAALKTLRPGGSITFVTAISARMANPGTAGLAAINGALEAMVRPLAKELKPTRVNAVSPGVIDTPWWDRLPADQRQATFDCYADLAPVGRVERAGDVAACT